MDMADANITADNLDIREGNWSMPELGEVPRVNSWGVRCIARNTHDTLHERSENLGNKDW